MRRFVDDFGWVARISERADGTCQVFVATADGVVVWDRELPSVEVALVQLRLSFPRLQEVA